MMGPFGTSRGYFDPRQAAHYAKSAPALPPGWTRFPFRGMSIADGLVGVALGLLAGLLALAFLLRGTVFTSFDYQPLVQGGTFALLWLLVILFNLFLCVGLLAGNVPSLRALGHLRDFYFLVTPDGVAQVNGVVIVGLPITDVAQARLNWNRRTLVITRRSGEIVRLRGMNDYHHVNEIVGAIVAARDQALYAMRPYSAAYVPLTPPTPQPFTPSPQPYNHPYPNAPYRDR